MPKARPALAAVPPSLLSVEEAEFVKTTVARFYGCDAVVRNFGPDPDRILLHVETSSEASHLRECECLGFLLTRIDRRSVDLYCTVRGHRVFGQSKLAYRQGVVI